MVVFKKVYGFMKLSKRVLNVISKYKDLTYLEKTPKYIISYDLQSIGIDVKPCYDTDVLKGIIKVLLERV